MSLPELMASLSKPYPLVTFDGRAGWRLKLSSGSFGEREEEKEREREMEREREREREDGWMDG